MKVLILNQYVPPDRSPTAVLVGDMADLLRGQGHEPVCIGQGDGYGVRRSGLSRWVHEMVSWLRILVAGWAESRAGAVVVMTSPPCLLLAGMLVSMRHRARLVHWVMDLYPETAVALGECGAGLGGLISRVMVPAYRACDAVIALDEDMRDLIGKKTRVIPAVLPPWPPSWALPPASGAGPRGPGEPEDTKGRRIWMYSGNLGRAHDWETLLGAQEILEKNPCPWDLVFQGGGAGYDAAREEAARRGLRHCRFLPYAAPGDLAQSLLVADVLVATRRPEMQGLLWPSKLAVLSSLPRPIVWVGETTGAVADFLATREGTALFASGDAKGLAGWLCGPVPTNDFPQGVSLEKGRRKSQDAWLEIFANALK